MRIDADVVNGLAGLAALVNSLLMWPTIKAIKRIALDLDRRVSKLEERDK
jgi:hypothetical protein